MSPKRYKRTFTSTRRDRNDENDSPKAKRTADSGEAETPRAEARGTVGETPRARPGQTPRARPGEIPRARPGEIPRARPAETPRARPAETFRAIAADAPRARSAETPRARPAEALRARPAETPRASPAETPRAIAEDTPRARPAETPRDIAAETPRDIAAETPAVEIQQRSEQGKSRKRVCTPSSWKSVCRKRLYQEGKEHMNTSKETVPAKQIKTLAKITFTQNLFSVQYSTSHAQLPIQVDIRGSNTKTRSNIPTALLLPEPKYLTNKNTIAEAKKTDLLSMFKYMPAVDKAYYSAVFRK
ncbi:coiled-coil domain-containing protein 8 homolog [Engraulis encrasicolus]|uniref:coiled-coil domain-containing protein 8 homolog n=1 Tax=Engraulis encrasicolus TaxID=184585 RepID=UPI002FD42A6F